MKERPILFSGPMVRAILEGRKTQTRRVVCDSTSQGNFRASELLLDDPRTFIDPGPSPAGNPGYYLHAYVDALKIEAARGWKRGDCDADCIERLYPRWMPGDRLWVRETFCMQSNFNVDSNEAYPPPFSDGRPVRHVSDNDWADYWQQASYRATDPEPELCYENGKKGCKRCEQGDPHGHWQPSIYMPRWASRLLLEVKSIRVELLLQITDADAIAEGIQDLGEGVGRIETKRGVSYSTVRGLYAGLWDSINAKRGHGWESNPWVWVVEFERVQP